MTLPGFVILIVLAVIAVSIFLELAAIPGTKARERGHPQAEAINVLGWIGLLVGGPGWVVALALGLHPPRGPRGARAGPRGGGPAGARELFEFRMNRAGSSRCRPTPSAAWRHSGRFSGSRTSRAGLALGPRGRDRLDGLSFARPPARFSPRDTAPSADVRRRTRIKRLGAPAIPARANMQNAQEPA
jgi:hypothetical protein